MAVRVAFMGPQTNEEGSPLSDGIVDGVEVIGFFDGQSNSLLAGQIFQLTTQIFRYAARGRLADGIIAMARIDVAALSFPVISGIV